MSSLTDAGRSSLGDGAPPGPSGQAEGMTSSTSPPPVTDVTAPPETIVGDAANQHRATSYVVGATTLLWDRVRTPRQRPGLREIAVGAVFEAEDVARVLLGGV